MNHVAILHVVAACLRKATPSEETTGDSNQRTMSDLLTLIMSAKHAYVCLRRWALDAQNRSQAIRLTVFLVAYTRLYKPLCWSVGPSVAVHEACDLWRLALFLGFPPKTK